jgi:hypothetical protein
VALSSGGAWVADFGAATPVLRERVSNTDVQPYGNGFLLITKPISIIGPPVERVVGAESRRAVARPRHRVLDRRPAPSRVAGDTYHAAYTYNPIVLATNPSPTAASSVVTT